MGSFLKFFKVLKSIIFLIFLFLHLLILLILKYLRQTYFSLAFSLLQLFFHLLCLLLYLQRDLQCVPLLCLLYDLLPCLQHVLQLFLVYSPFLFQLPQMYFGLLKILLLHPILYQLYKDFLHFHLHQQLLYCCTLKLYMDELLGNLYLQDKTQHPPNQKNIHMLSDLLFT